MKLGRIKSFKRLNILEKIISLFSIVAGLYMIYSSGYLMYAYHFADILFLFMVPMTSLVSRFIIGLFLTYSGLRLVANRQKTPVFFKLTGILIMLYPINLNILEILRDDWTIKSLYLLIFFAIGLFFYLFFNQEKYIKMDQVLSLFRLDSIKFFIGFLVFLLIDTIFFKWDYLGRVF